MRHKEVGHGLRRVGLVDIREIGSGNGNGNEEEQATVEVRVCSDSSRTRQIPESHDQVGGILVAHDVCLVRCEVVAVI